MRFVIEVIDGNDVLVDCIIQVWHIKLRFFFGHLNILKIADGIVTHIAEESVLNELLFVVFGFKFFSKTFNDAYHIGITLNGGGCGSSVRENFGDHFVFYGDRSDRFAADVAEGVVVSPVVATLEEQAVWELITQTQVNRHRSDGICKNFFAVGF